jgi:flagellar hook-length control protein FliK
MIALPAVAAVAAVPARPSMPADATAETDSEGGGFAAALELARDPAKADGAVDAKAGDAPCGESAHVADDRPSTADKPADEPDAVAPDLTALLPGWTPVPAMAPASAPATTVAFAATEAPDKASPQSLADTQACRRPSAAGGNPIRGDVGEARTAMQQAVRNGPLATATSSKPEVARADAMTAATTRLRDGPDASVTTPAAMEVASAVKAPSAKSMTTPSAVTAATDPASALPASKGACESTPPMTTLAATAATSLSTHGLQAPPQLNLPHAVPVAPPFEARLAAAIDSPAFAPALANQVTWLASEGVQHARITLNPAEMGPLAVRIALDGTQARIDFSADMAGTRAVIEAGLPALAAALHDSGLTLAGGGVFDGQARQGTPEGRPANPTGATPSGNGPPSDGRAPTTPPLRAARGLVDLVA